MKTYTDYPQAATNNAKTALRWVEKNGWGSCGTSVGKERAHQLANREPLSRDTIARMAAFERHRQNSKRPLGQGCGRLMWLCWGGNAGVSWAQRKLAQIDKESKNEGGTSISPELKNEEKNLKNKNLMRIDLFNEIDYNSSKELIEKIKCVTEDEIDLYINSYGGSVLDGYSILSALANSGRKIHVYIEGYCASMAAIIAMFGDEVCMAKHSLLMFHKPYSENSDLSDSDKIMLEKTAESLKILASKRIPLAELNILMENEMWLTAQEALELKIIDSVYDLGVSVERDALLEAKASKNLNLIMNLFNRKKEKEKMDDEVKDIKKVEMEEKPEVEDMKEEADDMYKEGEEADDMYNEEEGNGAEEMERKLLEMEKQIAELLIKIQKYEDAENKAADEKIKKIVNKAIEDNKIEKGAFNEWVTLLSNNFDTGVKMLDGIKNHKSAPALNYSSNKETNPKSSWTIRDYEEKDEKGLLKIKNETPELFKAMFKDYYKTDYNG
jgi:ATP-dependent protease ClpP protease subunit